MADKSVKVTEEKVSVDWKHTPVSKEHQPAKVTSTVTYAQLEDSIKSVKAQQASLVDTLAGLEAELAKVEAAAKG